MRNLFQQNRDKFPHITKAINEIIQILHPISTLTEHSFARTVQIQTIYLKRQSQIFSRLLPETNKKIFKFLTDLNDKAVYHGMTRQKRVSVFRNTMKNIISSIQEEEQLLKKKPIITIKSEKIEKKEKIVSLHSFEELKNVTFESKKSTDSLTEENMSQLQINLLKLRGQAEKLSKIPKFIPPGSTHIIESNLPIIVTMASFNYKRWLNSGGECYQVASAWIFNDGYFLGFDVYDLKQDPYKLVNDTLLQYPNLQLNPTGLYIGDGYITLPGNPLHFVWTLPNKLTAAVENFVINSIAFPTILTDIKQETFDEKSNRLKKERERSLQKFEILNIDLYNKKLILKELILELKETEGESELYLESVQQLKKVDKLIKDKLQTHLDKIISKKIAIRSVALELSLKI